MNKNKEIEKEKAGVLYEHEEFDKMEFSFDGTVEIGGEQSVVILIEETTGVDEDKIWNNSSCC